MKFKTAIPVTKIAKQINATIIGNSDLRATGINEIHKVKNGDITFVDVEKYFDKSLNSAASIIILNKQVSCPPGKALLVCEAPFEAYNQIVLEHRPYVPLTNNRGQNIDIHSSTIIEPNVIIGPHVKIGKNCHIQANVTVAEHSIIGNNVIIQSGSVIGTEAFYFKRYPDHYKKWRSGGRVIIEDNVFAAQVGIGGKTIVEDEVVLYGQVGIAQNLHIGKKAIVLAKSGVSKSLEGGKVYFGTPAEEARGKYKELAALRQLPDFLKNYRS